MLRRRRHWARLALAAGIVTVVSFGAVDVQAKQKTLAASAPATSAVGGAVPTLAGTRSSQIGSSGAATLAPIPSVARDVTQLAVAVDAQITGSGASVGVTLVELGGDDPISWSVNGGEVFTAASTYKLAALMLEAENIASGKTDPNGYVCFQDADYEPGWFDDYDVGVCLTRNELAVRAGIYSDNTAGHMLVRDVGGATVLNAWAASIGATSSQFFDANTTTSADLAALWEAEAEGDLGGAAAQAWLYPVLTGTRTESGVPAGVSGSTVVHKTGTIDLVENDAALVTPGPDGAYVLVVMTDGIGGTGGWELVAGISAGVSQFEAARAASN
jgi:beta-lactamase class A